MRARATRQATRAAQDGSGAGPRQGTKAGPQGEPSRRGHKASHHAWPHKGLRRVLPAPRATAPRRSARSPARSYCAMCRKHPMSGWSARPPAESAQHVCQLRRTGGGAG
eukprot:3386150-Pleurochrysis_carterae.AAC.2